MFTVYHFTRWFGAPCTDHCAIIGTVDHMPETVDDAARIVESFGLRPVHGSPATYSDGLMFDIDVEFPAHRNIDCSWVQIVERF